MSREFEYDPLRPCDNCNRIGSYDIYGDFYCQKCLDSFNEDEG